MPTQTILVTPDSAARATLAASLVACGPPSSAPPPSPGPVSANSSWRWQWESNHSTTASPMAPVPALQALRRGKSGDPFSTVRPAG